MSRKVGGGRGWWRPRGEDGTSRTAGQAQKRAALVRSLALLTLSLAFLWPGAKEAGEIQSRLAYVLVAGCCYVLITAFLPLHRLNPRTWERVCLAADVAFISVAVFFSGGTRSNYQLLYYLPIVHASLRLGLRDVLEAAVLVAGAYLFVVLLEAWLRPEKALAWPEALIFVGIGFLLAVFMGTLAWDNREYLRQGERARRLVEALREANARLSEYSTKLERLSISDALTGVMNRRGFEQKVEEELNRARRFGRPISVLLVDMNGLKKYNDRYGHFHGDLALAHVSRVLREGVRGIDVVARYGGDEFVVILPETDREGAKRLADKLRGSPTLLVANSPEMLKENLGVSIGWATFPEDGDTKELLVQRADAVMYASKAALKTGA